MDGKGRAYDNIFVERFWRTLKYEDVDLKGYGTVAECVKGLDSFICRYSDIREHSFLDEIRHRMYILERSGLKKSPRKKIN